jgi:DnaA family protein
MRQLALELASPPAPTLDNFVTGANAEAVAALREMVGGAPAERFIYLWGAPGSGRSHLLRAVLKSLSDAGRRVRLYGLGETPLADEGDDVVGVDDVQTLDGQAQINLFNIFNNLKESPRGAGGDRRLSACTTLAARRSADAAGLGVGV